MNDGRPVLSDRLPTLTEVVEPARRAPDLPAPRDAVAPLDLDQGDQAALVASLLGPLQQRIDLLFEARLREAVAPALARAVDGLLRELGPELARTLRETAERAVALELTRRRGGK